MSRKICKQRAGKLSRYELWLHLVAVFCSPNSFYYYFFVCLTDCLHFPRVRAKGPNTAVIMSSRVFEGVTQKEVSAEHCADSIVVWHLDTDNCSFMNRRDTAPSLLFWRKLTAKVSGPCHAEVHWSFKHIRPSGFKSEKKKALKLLVFYLFFYLLL